MSRYADKGRGLADGEDAWPSQAFACFVGAPRCGQTLTARALTCRKPSATTTTGSWAMPTTRSAVR